ncbi:hypothetical protein FJZ33_01785 [Candidatus Poribacteria bacterium]|nr:hypothetical protein [Candidatus Poribacteria bacterium]
MKFIVFLFIFLTLAHFCSASVKAIYWPQWRGPEMIGISPDGDPPLEWGENKNIKWKIEIPGKGYASPIIWDNKVFIQTAIETEKDTDVEGTEAKEAELPEWRRQTGTPAKKVQRFTIIAINREDGQILWQRVLREEAPHAGTHADGSWASNSPVTDGERVYAFFGSYGLYCLDMQGNPIWNKDFGYMKIKMSFGEGSSPVLYGDVIIINWDHEDQSFIIALDKRTGKELWKKERNEVTSWSTPIVIEHDGKTQVIVSASDRIRSYELETGNILWECSGMTLNVVPSPVIADGIIYVASGFRGNSLMAIKLDGASGDISNTDFVLWRYNQNTPYVPSPLVYGGSLYILKTNDGILTCLDAKTGEVYYSEQRLSDIKGVYSSPVGAKDRVYIVGRNGVTYVIKGGPEFKVLAINSLDDSFAASPAVVDKEMLLRGHKYLYCIADDKGE